MREAGRILSWGVVASLVAALVGVLAGGSPALVIGVALAVALVAAVAFEVAPPLRELRLRPPVEKVPRGDWRATAAERHRRYGDHRGLFLVHEARVPSKDPNQIADAYVRLVEHEKPPEDNRPANPGPLTRGAVAGVEYVLGPKFDEHSVVKTASRGGFPLEVSLYAPLLVLARVSFKDKTPDLLLERYINFPGDHTTPDATRPSDGGGRADGSRSSHLF